MPAVVLPFMSGLSGLSDMSGESGIPPVWHRLGIAHLGNIGGKSPIVTSK
jgi:hypothetical protein